MTTSHKFYALCFCLLLLSYEVVDAFKPFPRDDGVLSLLTAGLIVMLLRGDYEPAPSPKYSGFSPYELAPYMGGYEIEEYGFPEKFNKYDLPLSYFGGIEVPFDDMQEMPYLSHLNAFNYDLWKK